MKKLLIVAVLAIVCNSCTWKKVNLKPGQMFTHHFGYGTETWIVKKVVEGGFICTDTKWLWSENYYISAFDLKTDDQFFELGMYENYGVIKDSCKTILKPFPHLKSMDMIYFNYVGIVKGVVEDTTSNGIYFTVPGEWLWSSVQYISYDDLRNDKTFKYLGRYKPHR